MNNREKATVYIHQFKTEGKNGQSRLLRNSNEDYRGLK